MPATILSDNGVSSGSAGIKTTGANDGVLALQTTTAGGAATTAVTIDTSQKVGIGTSLPAAGLDVDRGATNGFTARFGRTSGTQFYMYSDTTASYLSTETGLFNAIGFAPASNFINFYTNNAERARIDSSGNLLLGDTSNPVDIRLYIKKTTATGDCQRIVNASNSTGVSYISFRYGTGTPTETGYISTNGTGTTYSTTSDYRLKEQVQPMTGALAKIAVLKPVTYKWKVDGSDGEGFIAHELQEVVPDCVTGEKDAVDAEGNPVYQGIDTSFLVATLTAAIQEQQALIQSLTARIATLEGAKENGQPASP